MDNYSIVALAVFFLDLAIGLPLIYRDFSGDFK